MPVRQGYEGIIYFNPSSEREVQATDPIAKRTPGTKEFFTLSRQELEVLLPRCVGAPIRTEHGLQHSGKVTAAFFDSQGNAVIQFHFEDNDVGRFAKKLVDEGTHRGLSLCHLPRDMRVKEVSICEEGARPNTGITREVMVAASKTNSPSYMAPSSSTWINTRVPAVFQPTRVMQAPSHPQQQQQQTAPENKISLTPDQLKNLMESSGTTAPPQQQQQQQAPQESSMTYRSFPQAQQYAQQVMQNAQGTPFQPPSDTSVMAPPPPQQQQQQQPPPGEAKKHPREEVDQDVDMAPEHKSKKSKKEAQGDAAQAEAGAQGTPAEIARDIVEEVAKHNGRLSLDQQNALLEHELKRRKDQQKMTEELNRLRRENQELVTTKGQLNQQFTDTMLPFMKRILGGNHLTSDQEQNMRQVAQTAEGQKFLSAWAQPMRETIQVAASRMNAQPPVDPKVQKRLQLLQAYQESRGAAASGAAPVGVAQQIQEPYSMNPTPQQYGWVPTQQVAASAATASRPAAPSVMDPSSIVIPSFVANGDNFSLSDVGIQKQIR